MQNRTNRILTCITCLCVLILIVTALIISLSGEGSSGNTFNSSYFVTILLLVMIPITQEQKHRIITRHIQNKKKKGIKSNMKDFVAAYIDKECLIYTVNGQVGGTVKAVSESALQVETKSGLQVLNIDYVVRIREYPRNKKGNK